MALEGGGLYMTQNYLPMQEIELKVQGGLMRARGA